MVCSAIFWILVLSSSLIVAVALFERYRRRKQHLEDILGSLDVICHLAKYPYEKKESEDLCIALMMKHLISANASTLLPGRFLINPFLSACFGGSLKLIHFMLEKGADVNWSNLNGDGAGYLAVYGIICRLKLAKQAAQRSIEIQRGILVIDSLIASGCLVNKQNSFGFTSLHLAAASGEKWLVDHLLKRGADPLQETSFSHALPSTFASEMKQLQLHTLLKDAEYNCGTSLSG